MAPSKRLNRKLLTYERNLILWRNCSKQDKVPNAFVSLDTAEREFGLCAKSLTQSELKTVLYGKRRGQYGFFLPPALVSARLKKPEVPSHWLSELFLRRCLERKGGFPPNTVSSFRSSWAIEGRKKGQKGPTITWWYPPQFLTDEFDIAVIRNGASVKFKGQNPVNQTTMKGIDVTSPPMLPQYFKIRKGCESDIYVGEKEDSEEETSELDTGMIADPDNSNIVIE